MSRATWVALGLLFNSGIMSCNVRCKNWTGNYLMDVLSDCCGTRLNINLILIMTVSLGTLSFVDSDWSRYCVCCFWRFIGRTILLHINLKYIFLCCVLIQDLCIFPELGKPSEFLVSKIVRHSFFLSELDVMTQTTLGKKQVVNFKKLTVIASQEGGDCWQDIHASDRVMLRWILKELGFWRQLD